MSRIGLRQLLVLLALTSTLAVSMNVLWVSNSLHQQALLEHSLKNQQGYAALLASKLQWRLQQGAQTAPFDSLEPTEQQRIWVISNDGKVLFPAGSDLAPAQERGLDGRYREHSALIRDEQGVERMTSVVAVPGTDWLLVLQTALSERPRLQWALVDILAAVLPASLLLILLAWLAGGRACGPPAWFAGCLCPQPEPSGKHGRNQGSAAGLERDSRAKKRVAARHQAAAASVVARTARRRISGSGYRAEQSRYFAGARGQYQPGRHRFYCDGLGGG